VSGIYLILDLMPGSADIDQVIAEWNAAALCTDCENDWDGKLSTRPTCGAFAWTSPSEIYEETCRHHLEISEFIAICPMPEGWEPE
jgi:hypothetical protein